MHTNIPEYILLRPLIFFSYHYYKQHNHQYAEKQQSDNINCLLKFCPFSAFCVSEKVDTPEYHDQTDKKYQNSEHTLRRISCGEHCCQISFHYFIDSLVKSRSPPARIISFVRPESSQSTGISAPFVLFTTVSSDLPSAISFLTSASTRTSPSLILS